MSNIKLLNEAAQMIKNLSSDDLGKLYRAITLDRRLLHIPQNYVKKLRETKDLLSVYFMIVLDVNVKRETYKKFIPTVHELLLELGQTPPKSDKLVNYTHKPIKFVEQIFELGSSAAQTNEPVAVYGAISHFAPRIDEALGAVGQGEKLQKNQANKPRENNNNNNNNDDGAANENVRAANKKKGANKTKRRSGRGSGSGAGSGGGKRKKSRKH